MSGVTNLQLFDPINLAVWDLRIGGNDASDTGHVATRSAYVVTGETTIPG